MTEAPRFEDQIAVQATIQRYALAVDSGRFELFDQTFTADARLDYRSAGGPDGGRDQVRRWLEQSRAGLLRWQHHLSPSIITFDGSTAVGRTDVYTANVFKDPTGRVHVLHAGGCYHDELVHTRDGWRIHHRRFENTWADGPGVDVLLPDPTRAA